MRETDWTKILGWPGYRVYRHEINEGTKTLKLWVRSKRWNRKLVCSGCGRKLSEVYDTYEREHGSYTRPLYGANLSTRLKTKPIWTTHFTLSEAPGRISKKVDF